VAAPAEPALGPACDPASLTADLAARDQIPQSPLPPASWYVPGQHNGRWGPGRSAYPSVDAPAGCDAVAWRRARVVAVAQRYLDLPYRHHHIPAWDPPASLVGEANAGPGLDCSNYTAWVYNYALGIRFTSDINKQADGPEAPGRRLAPDEPLAPGDLLFILQRDRSRVSHVVIYVDENTVIDSGGGAGRVWMHPLEGWYQTHYVHARRVIE
jgi:cell wall-associated NlpC family hydrolase